eukprot:Sspe_Gene.71587::Locus_42505_Transcript_1_1_Confidence_1.000_Length_394::g.71587::m.71587
MEGAPFRRFSSSRFPALQKKKKKKRAVATTTIKTTRKESFPSPLASITISERSDLPATLHPTTYFITPARKAPSFLLSTAHRHSGTADESSVLKKKKRKE